MDMNGKKVLVVGAGRSGIGALRLLKFNNEPAVLLEQDKNKTAEDVRLALPEEIRDYADIITGDPDFGKEPEELFSYAVISPAVPADSELCKMLAARGVEILSEIELAYRSEKGRVIAITGTNGKTTTTSLVGAIMSANQKGVHIVGNIGNAYAGEVTGSDKDSVSVAEISSFQLECCSRFHPCVSAILNITPDHLNRHYTMDNYAAIKMRVAMNQTKEDTCVLNYNDPRLRAFGEEKCPAKVVWFSSGEEPENGFYVTENTVYRIADGERKELIRADEVQLVGLCNMENIAAAYAVCEAMGVPEEVILSGIRDFAPVEHRIEYSGTVSGVRYYNDSKATNPDAAIWGIRAMKWPTVLIAGGYNKNNTYDEWIEAFDGKVKALMLIGETAGAIAECAKAHSIENIHFFETFDECLRACTQAAEEGDCVLLSPACASWGMFPNYEVRGRMFKEYVQSLMKEGGEEKADA
ncbi:MAG: UDP-N-acetylmuramoyl-L-alanine--D-glutamate ligase [Lachnospiraceae bacterium]|nr:UDP-N-acetylmuramoyl-L-alanine--D-glutamate ligase [Lachnospiraceae bacterium]